MCIVAVALLAGCGAFKHHEPQPAVTVTPPKPAAVSRPHAFKAVATAYSQKGVTADGSHAHQGIVAADPDVLPLGSVIRITDAHGYSGEYVVRDTGKKVDGRHIDIFMPTKSEAKRFGKRTVEVQVVRYGDGSANR